MKHQRHVRKFPTEKPPDLESKSPGAVGTATGADLQTFLQKTNESYREPDVNVRSAAVLSNERSVSCNGGHCDRYSLVLDGGPLFAVTLIAEQVRDATSFLVWNGGDSETQKPHQNTAEAEAATPTADMVTPLVAVGASPGHGVAP
jgi:hypothetical protein